MTDHQQQANDFDEPVASPFFLSAQQKSLWDIDPNHTQQILLGLDERITLAHIKGALTQLTQRHGSITHRYEVMPGYKYPQQHVTTNEHVIGPIDCTELTIDSGELEHISALVEPGSRLAYWLTVKASQNHPSQRHYLLLSVAALSCDMPSLLVLVSELDQLLNRQQLPTLDADYEQFANWHASCLDEDDEDYQQAQSLWLAKRDDIGVSLPNTKTADFSAPHSLLSPVTNRCIRVSADVSARLSNWADERELSLQSIFLSATLFVLHRLSRAERIVINQYFECRPFDELANLVGCLEKPLSMSSVLYDNDNFAALCRRVERKSQALNDSVEYFPETMPLSDHALASIGYYQQPYTEPLNCLSIESIAGQFIQQQTSNHRKSPALAFSFVELNTGEQRPILMSIESDSSQYDEGETLSLLERIQLLLEQVVAEPELQMSQATLLLQRDQELLASSQGRAAPQPISSVIDRFAHFAKHYPERDAVIAEDDSLSYRQLDEYSDYLATELLQQTDNNRPNLSLIPVYMSRGVWSIVSMLACMKAGLPFVPIEAAESTGAAPSLPNRTTHLLNNIAPQLILTDQHYQPAIEELGCSSIAVDSLLSAGEKTNREPPATSSNSNQIAYVIYTSGTTGEPKGVMVTQRNLGNYCASLALNLTASQQHSGDSKQQQFACVSTLSADLGYTAVFGAMTSGACLHLLNYTTVTDDKTYADYMQAHQIDLVKMVPSHLHALLNSAEVSGTPVAHLLPKKSLILGGETFSLTLHQTLTQIKQTHELNCQIFNHYGPSETTIGCFMLATQTLATEQSMANGSLLYASSMPIGRPMLNTGFRVVDENGSSVLPFMTGELIVTGAGIAAGYLNATEQEQLRFTDVQVNGQTQRGFYTRDKVRLLPDGCIEFIGRMDDQVKLRGYRVELDAIQQQILRHSSIRQVSVKLHQPKNTTGEARLVAWYVENNQTSSKSESRVRKGYTHADNEATDEREKQVLIDEIIAYISQSLPDYMLPTQWIKVAKLPLTLNGKVDHKALPDADESLEKNKKWEPPVTEYEHLVADIWAELLNQPRCGLNDHFFELGGNSLLATQVVARLRKQTGKDIAIADLFDHPTLQAQANCLAQLVEKQQKSNDTPQFKPVDPRLSYPLSFSQQRLWFLDQLNPNSAFYNVPAAIRFRGEHDQSRIFDALQAVWQCHDGLRIRISTGNGNETTPQQTISQAPLEIYSTDLRALDEEIESRQQRAAILCQQEARTPFNLHLDPLMRAHFIRINDDESLLLVTLHHIISDAWSTDLLLQEFARSYQGHALQRPPFNSVDFSQWQQDFYTPEREASEMAFWKNTLREATQYIPLPLDRARPEYQSWRGARVHMRIDNKLMQPLDALASGGRYSRFMLLMTAFNLMLHQQTGAEDLSITVPLAGRNPEGLGEGLEQTIGLFLNSLIVRCQLSQAITARQLTDQMRTYLLSAYEHQSLPFDRVIRQLPIERATSYTPFNQVCFNLLNTPLGKSLTPLNSDKLQANLEISDTCTAKYDMEWILAEEEGEIDLCVEYNADLFDEQSIERMMTQFNEWLSWLPAHFDCAWASPHTALKPAQAQLLLQRQTALSTVIAPTYATRTPSLANQILTSEHEWLLNTEQVRWFQQSNLLDNPSIENWLTALASLSVSCYLEGTDDYVCQYNDLSLVVFAKYLEQKSTLAHALNALCQQIALQPLTSPDSVVLEPSHNALHIVTHAVDATDNTEGADALDTCQLWISKTNQYRITLVDNASRLPGLLNVMQNVLQQIMQAPELTIDRVNWLSDPQQKALFNALSGNQSSPVATPHNPLLAALEEGLKHNPNAIAVSDAEGELSYHNLHSSANQLARQLIVQRKATTDNDHITPAVALLIQPGRRWIIAMLATIKAGYMYLPLDCQLPAKRIASILQDANCHHLWFDNCYQSRIDNVQNLLDSASIEIDVQPWSAWVASAAQQPFTALREAEVIASFGHSSSGTTFAERALYAIYTSGSTGEPKGAMVTHANARNLLDWYVTEYSITAMDRILVISSLGFDLTQKNLFASLSRGARLVFPDMQYFDADAVANTIQDQKISLLNCAPSAFYSVLDVCNDDFSQLRSLRYLMLGGEGIDLSRLQYWLTGTNCHTQIVNMYGPTECTDIACSYTLSQKELASLYLAEHLPESLPIGFANDGVQLLVLDEQRRILPPGVVGELAIAGAGVGKGYIQRPELMNSVFVRHPFIADEDIYCTGDRVYLDHNSALVFAGRRDHQIKHRGFRIELSGIRNAILQLENVAEAAALLVEDHRCQPQLVAVVQPIASAITNSQAESEIIDALKTALADSIPGYMLPERWEVKLDMPLNRNGKLDLNALVHWVQNQTHSRDGQLPRSEQELWLAQLWQSVLNLDQVFIDDDFFLIGGHSLMATQLVSRIRKETGLDVALSVIFEHSSLASMAAAIANLQTRELTSELQLSPPLIAVDVGAEGTDSDTRWPLSYAQQRLWFTQNLNPESHDYNMSSVLKISGRVDSVALDQACCALMRRHTTLRTRFVQDLEAEHGVYQQVVSVPSQFLSVHRLEAPYSSEQAFVAQADPLITQVTNKPFDLCQSPVWRASLITGADDVHLLAITLHHIAADGWSMAILIRELWFFYQQATGVLPVSVAGLPALPVQYTDYAAWQRNTLQGEWLTKLSEYWQQQLAGAPHVTKLATDRPRTTDVESKGERLPCEIPSALSQKVYQLAQQQGITVYMLLMTAFNVVLHGHTKETDLVIGTDLANRNRQELENLIGFFVNVLPIRVHLGGNPSFKQLLQRVKQTTLGAYAHQDLPFDKLVEVINPDRSPLYHPLFQVLFVLQNAPTTRLASDSIGIEVISQPQQQLRFDLALLLEEKAIDDSAGTIEGHWAFSSALFDVSTINALNESLLEVLDAAVSDCALPLNQLLRQRHNNQRSATKRQARQSRIGRLKKGVSPKGRSPATEDS